MPHARRVLLPAQRQPAQAVDMQEDVAEIRAIWIMADSTALAQVEQYTAFSL